MKPDSMMVEPDFLVNARQVVSSEGSSNVLAHISNQEPVLAAYIHESLASMAGKLAIAGAPTQLVQAVHEDAMSVALTAVQALRQGHYELWKDTMTGTRLEELDPAFKVLPAAADIPPAALPEPEMSKVRNKKKRRRKPEIEPDETPPEAIE